MPLPGKRPHARNLLRHAHSHRLACNSVYAAIVGDSLDLDIIDNGWSELEIQSGDVDPRIAPFPYRSVDGDALQKVPDLLITAEDGDAPIWVEVENAWRGSRDFRRVVSFLRTLCGSTEPPVSAVWFVVTAPGAKSIGKRLRLALTHGPDSGYGVQVRTLDAFILERWVKVFQLDHDKLELKRLPL